MRILGIDPGLQTTGFGVIDRHGPQLQYVASGTIRTTRTPGVALGDLPERLKIIFRSLGEVVAALPAQHRRGGDRVRERQSAIHPAARAGARCGFDRLGGPGFDRGRVHRLQ